jgi:5-methylthioadenosine/S-adenosylhomocysteine deaminase
MQTVDILIQAGGMLPMTGDDVVHDAVIAVKDSRIVYAGPAADARDEYESDTVIGSPEMVVMPGLVNGHTHVGSQIYGTLCDDADVLNALYEIIIPMEPGFDEELLYGSARLGLWDAIRGGVTTICDLYHFPEATAKAAKEVGMRGLIADKIIEFRLEDPFDFDPTEQTYSPKLNRPEAERRLANNIAFVEKWKGDPLVNPILGPHGSDTLSTEMLLETAKAAEALDVKMHMHLAQSASEIATVKRLGYPGSVHYLSEIGFLSPRLHAAHMWFTSDEEIKIAADSGMSMSFNPVIAIACHQFARIDSMVKEGMTIAMGTDCLSMDQLEDMRMGIYVTNYLRGSDEFALRGKQLLEMATIGGARALGLDDEIGTLEVGKKADIIVLDLKDGQLVPNTNYFESIAYYTKSRNLAYSIIDGELVYAGGRLVKVDQDEIFAEGRRCAHEYIRRGKHVLDRTGVLPRIDRKLVELEDEAIASAG